MPCASRACEGQEKASDPLKLELLMIVSQCSCWELNLGPQEELSVLLIAEPPLWPYLLIVHSRYFNSKMFNVGRNINREKAKNYSLLLSCE